MLTLSQSTIDPLILTARRDDEGGGGGTSGVGFLTAFLIAGMIGAVTYAIGFERGTSRKMESSRRRRSPAPYAAQKDDE